MTGLIQAKWTDAIHNEWVSSVLRDRQDISPQQLKRTRELMNAHVPDCLVTGYEYLIDSLTLPDPNDRHVLAAAIHAGAKVIVTFNLQDFPADALKHYKVDAQHADDLITSLLEVAHLIVCDAAARQRASLKNPPKSVEQYLATLEIQGLPKTVSHLRQWSDLI